VVVIRAGSAAHAAQIAAVQRETWFAAYEGIIAPEVIDRVTVPDDGARVRQSFRIRPWQRMLVAVDPGAGDPGAGDPGVGGIVGYASFGPETDVLNAPWPHPLTVDGESGRVAELYALYVRPAWWSTGPSRCGSCATTSAPAGSTSGPDSRPTAPPTCSPGSAASSKSATVVSLTSGYNEEFRIP
jgi:hypothetical protein